MENLESGETALRESDRRLFIPMPTLFLASRIVCCCRLFSVAPQKQKKNRETENMRNKTGFIESLQPLLEEIPFFGSCGHSCGCADSICASRCEDSPCDLLPFLISILQPVLAGKKEKKVDNGFGDVAMRTAVVVGGCSEDNVNREHERGRQDPRDNAENPRPVQVSGYLTWVRGCCIKQHSCYRSNKTGGKHLQLLR